MIDVSRETLVLIRDVPRLLPPRPSGKRLHVSAVYRWLLTGVQGVVLDSIKVGGSTYTSVEALQRFAEAQSQGRTSPPVTGPATQTRQRAISLASERVRRELQLPMPDHPAPTGDS